MGERYLLSRKKVVGILTESALQTPTGASHAPRLSYAIVGIGINLWTPTAGFPKELQTIAGSVLDRPRQKEESDLRLALAKAVLERFEAFYRALPARAFMEEYRRRSLLIGQTVRVLDANHRAIEGYPPVTVLDVGDEAELIVALPDGTRRAIHSGEVSVRPKINKVVGGNKTMALIHINFYSQTLGMERGLEVILPQQQMASDKALRRRANGCPCSIYCTARQTTKRSGKEEPRSNAMRWPKGWQSLCRQQI